MPKPKKRKPPGQAPRATPRPVLRVAPLEREDVARLLREQASFLHHHRKSGESLGDIVYYSHPDEDCWVSFSPDDAGSDIVRLPFDVQAALVDELSRAKDEDALHLVVVDDRGMRYGRVGRDVLERDLEVERVFDARNHLPIETPADWYPAYRLEGTKDVYRIDTDQHTILVRASTREWPPPHFFLQVLVSRAYDTVPAAEADVAAILERFRNCGAFVDVTREKARIDPRHRVFEAPITAEPQGTPWPEIAPAPRGLAPPPGWEPVGSLRDKPLCFAIRGTPLRVTWTPPLLGDPMAAAEGRSVHPSTYAIAAQGRAVDEADVALVARLLGGAVLREVSRAEGGAEQVFESTAGWLRVVTAPTMN